MYNLMVRGMVIAAYLVTLVIPNPQGATHCLRTTSPSMTSTRTATPPASLEAFLGVPSSTQAKNKHAISPRQTTYQPANHRGSDYADPCAAGVIATVLTSAASGVEMVSKPSTVNVDMARYQSRMLWL